MDKTLLQNDFRAYTKDVLGEAVVKDLAGSQLESLCIGFILQRNSPSVDTEKPNNELVFPSDNDIETAALNYRDKSDNENTNEDTMQVDVHWYDKQEAFTAGVKWLMEKLSKQSNCTIPNSMVDMPDLFRNFIRTHHLTSKWELYLKENGGFCPVCGCNKTVQVEDETWCLNRNCGHEWQTVSYKNEPNEIK